jgi:hypothetical protein
VVCICGKCGCAEVDEAATAEARAKQIMPVSGEEPLVLEDHTYDILPGAAAPSTAAAPVEKAGFLSRIFSQQ